MVLEFVQDMCIQVITSDPNPKDLDMTTRLAGEHYITMALHNHSKPSTYWHLDTVLEFLKGRGNIKSVPRELGTFRIGSCGKFKKTGRPYASLHF